LTTETRYDTDPFAEGLHYGPTGASYVLNNGADFKSCGVTVGLYIENVDDGSNGLVTAVTETTVTCTLSGGTNNYWTYGDEYEIYNTATKGSRISTIHTDRRFGRKVLKKTELNKHGHFHADEDLDIDGAKVFGPGEPW